MMAIKNLYVRTLVNKYAQCLQNEEKYNSSGHNQNPFTHSTMGHCSNSVGSVGWSGKGNGGKTCKSFGEKNTRPSKILKQKYFPKVDFLDANLEFRPYISRLLKAGLV